LPALLPALFALRLRIRPVSVDPLNPTLAVPAAFRRVAGRFTTGISVVATSHGGVDHAMTVSAFTSVSLHPVLVLICVEKITRFHEAVLASGSWTVSVLSDDAADVSRWFAEKGRPTGRQMADYAHHPGPSTGMPVLDQAMAVLECRTRAVYDGGDHDILLGDVVGVWADPAARRPLLYFEGGYRQLR
jgi:flavin reductase (DIM6/NTAB) family NADH-FMN oxidoreductase RutF